MPACELQREAAELASRLMCDTRLVRGVDRGLWGAWPTHKAQEIDLSAWVEKHQGPGSQLELFEEGEAWFNRNSQIP